VKIVNLVYKFTELTILQIIGIHLILQAGMSSLDKLKSRWSNYDILNWGVDVKKNIPRQKDAYVFSYDSIVHKLQPVIVF
jgi:hypothetical protein